MPAGQCFVPLWSTAATTAAASASLPQTDPPRPMSHRNAARQHKQQRTLTWCSVSRTKVGGAAPSIQCPRINKKTKLVGGGEGGVTRQHCSRLHGLQHRSRRNTLRWATPAYVKARAMTSLKKRECARQHKWHKRTLATESRDETLMGVARTHALRHGQWGGTTARGVPSRDLNECRWGSVCVSA